MGNSRVKGKGPELKYQVLGESDLPSIILELVQLGKSSNYYLLRNKMVVCQFCFPPFLLKIDFLIYPDNGLLSFYSS